ncbi:coiled-coil domain-containing protein, partial [Helicobacter felis]|uniref:hypothetical protein n=1 Tax=Helicobacter felis TaxID=214 RepID=UPI0018F816E0
MGLVSSVNFRKTKNAVQTQHNDRSIKPYYLLPQEDVEKVGGGVEVNRSAEQADKLKNALVLKAMEDYKAHVGQSFQAKSYLWSAVVNIKPETTMQDLERLAAHFKNKYGFQCYQIAIHRDEGHKDEEGNIRLNQHAHLEFVTLDSVTGKNRYQKSKITPKALSQMQTETADILGMQRGEDVRKSGRKRIEPRAYGKLMNEVRQKHKAEKQGLKAEKDNAFNMFYEAGSALSTLYDSDLFTQQDREGLPPLNFGNLESNAKEMTKRAKKRYADRETTLTQQKQELETSNAELNTQLNELKGQHAKELKAKDTELATLTDLTGFVAPHDKKLTIKEIKPLLENVRLQWKDINQRLGEYKIFTQGDYKALRALKDEGLNINDLKKRIVALEQEAKEHKDYKSPQEVSALKAEHAKDVANLKQEHSKELDKAKQEITTLKTANTNLETAHAKDIKDLKDQHAQDVEKLKQAHSTKEAQLTQERDKAISQFDSATKTAQELTDAKTKTETALTNLQTAYKALETKYSALETSQTNNTQKLEDLRQKHTKELEKLNTAHTKAVEDLNAASALKDKQIVELTAQKQKAEQKASSLEKENEALRGSQYVVNVYANSRLKNSLNYERFFADARDQGHPIVGFLVGKHICYFALKNPEWEDLKGRGLFLGRAEKPDYEALLLETIKRYYAKLLDWVGGNNVLEGVGWKDGLEIVERDDDKGIGGLNVGGDVDLATAIEKCYNYDRLAHWQEKDEGGGILESVRIPPHASKAFETRIAPVWFKPRLEGLNIRLYDFLGKDLPQIDVVAFKDGWGLMRETMDYIASLNRQKLRDTHKEKRQQHAKGWYARS